MERGCSSVAAVLSGLLGPPRGQSNQSARAGIIEEDPLQKGGFEETRPPKPQLVWVSVVVVLAGAGTVVFSVVVVVLTGAGTVVSVVVVLFVGSAFFSFTVVQAHSDKRAAARQGMIRCFMDMMVVGVVTWRYEIASSAGQIIWGETRIVEDHGSSSKETIGAFSCG